MKINFAAKKDSLARIALGLKEGCCHKLHVCKEIAVKNRLFNIFSKKQEAKLTTTFPVQEEITSFAFENFHLLHASPSISFNEKPFKLYKKCVSKIGDFAEKTTANLGNLTFLDQIDAWSLVKSTVEKHPDIFFKVVNRKNKIESEITNKLGILLRLLEEIHIDVDMPALDQAAEQLEALYEIIEDHLAEASPSETRVLIEAKDLLVNLQNLLQDYQGFDDRECVRDALENTPLLTKLAPLTLSSAGAAISAFAIDQQGLLPPNWNPNNCLSYTILTKISSILAQASTIGNLFIGQNTTVFLGNVTLMAGTCALASYDDTEEDPLKESLNYMVSSLVNQVFVFTFAYIGTRLCGGKEKVKEFVENRISSTIAYKTCNAFLDGLGTSFYLNKSVSLIASAAINPLLKLTD